MREPLTAVPDVDGLPCAEVPSSCMWELVEYLSYQRVVVVYRYQTTRFTVTFMRTDMESAQCILNEWMHAEVPEPQMV